MYAYILIFIVVSNQESQVYGSTAKEKALNLDLNTFRQQNLLCHNTYREKHGVQPLLYNAKINQEAQDFAEKLATGDNFSTNDSLTYSQNLYKSGEPNLDGYIPCDIWYKENEQYNYDKDQPDNYEDIGHFTQMVSRASCYMGAGLATSSDGVTYFVVLYHPNGNIVDGYRRNVFPLGTNRHKTTEIDAMMRNVACIDADRETYLKQNIDCHNIVRKKYNVPPLTYNDKLNLLAQEKAKKLAKGGKGVSDLNLNNNYGMITFNAIIDGYNYCQDTYNSGRNVDTNQYHAMDRSSHINNTTLAFSQMIWKATRQIGFGMARSNDGNVYTVVMYHPPGNVWGQFRRNVFKPVDTDNEWLAPDPDSWERF